MASVRLYKLKKPTKGNPRRLVWMARWYGTNGKRYAKTLGDVSKMTKREAKSDVREMQGKMDNHLAPVNKPRKVTLGDFIKHDLEAIKADFRYTTILEYENAGNHAKKVLGSTIPIDRIGRREVSRIKCHLSEKLKRSDATVRKTIIQLAAMFHRAVDDGLIRENPFSGQAKGRTQSKRKRIFQPDEVDAMLAVCPDQWWRVFIKLAVTSGMRRGELLHLYWSDIDFEEKTVTISRKEAGQFKINDAVYPCMPWQAKTCEERTIPLPDDTLSMLQRFQLKSGGSKYVFLSLERLKAISARLESGAWNFKSEPINNLVRQFKLIQSHAHQWLAARRGIELDKLEWESGCPHDLRRTYGTHMSRSVPIHVLCKWLGHASMLTTQRYYLAVEGRDADMGRKALAALYEGKTDTQQTPGPNSHELPDAHVTRNRACATMRADCPGSSAG